MRFTVKDKTNEVEPKDIYFIHSKTNDFSNTNQHLANQKLGQLEDIEDELGIDLITLFKALKNGFWVRTPRDTKPQTYYYSFVNPKNDDDIYNEVSLDVFHKCIYDWDNYMESRCGVRRFRYNIHKTYKAKKGFAWALTKEELE